MKPVEHQLLVKAGLREDAYKDTIRVHRDVLGKVKVGGIAKVRVDGSTAHILAIRGLSDRRRGEILIDAITRDQLGVEKGTIRRFSFDRSNPLEKLTWACQATDPGARIAAWIAVWSGILGILGIFIGIYPLLK
jgi:hypothetical protein